jgi:DNA-3-methyladenine glycosylase II
MKNIQPNRRVADQSGDAETALRSADPKLARVIEAVTSRIGQQHLVPSHSSPFEALVRAVVYQSVSGKAAATIYGRLRLETHGAVTPAAITALPNDAIRAAGLSQSKAISVRNLAEWFSANRDTADRLEAMSNEAIAAALTSIPGIGAWTVNVFLIFNLGRSDVIPAADTGIRRGVQLTYGLKRLAPQALVREKALGWQPYASIASIYLWNAVKLKLEAKDLT